MSVSKDEGMNAARSHGVPGWLVLLLSAALLLSGVLLAGCGGGAPEPRAPGGTVLPPQGPSASTPAGSEPLPTGSAADLVRQGQAALDAGKMADAERLYKQAVAADSRSADAQFGLGNVYFRQSRLTEAETAYKAALAINPGLTVAHSNLGVVYYQQGQLQNAAGAFNAALKLKPDDAPTLYLLAAVHIQNSKLSEAETLLNRAKALQPNLAEVYYGLGALYNLQGKKTEAIAAFEEFIALGTAQDPRAMEEAQKQLQTLKGQ